GEGQVFIRTFPRRGFRFIGEVSTDEQRSGDEGGASCTSQVSGGHSLERVAQSGFRAVEGEPALRPATELFGEIAATTLPQVPQDTPSVAVLPLVADLLDRRLASFSDGLCEDIITALSGISRLLVIGRSSSFTYRGQEIDAKRAGRELGVAHVLEGSVRMSGM